MLATVLMLAALLLASSAEAQSTFTPTNVVPAPGSSLTASGSPLSVGVSFDWGGPALHGVFVEVASRNTAGQDGSLADDIVVARGEMAALDSNPTHYRGQLNGGVLPPGGYFFQFHVAYGPYVSPVYPLAISAPAVATPIPTGPLVAGPAPERLSMRAAAAFARRFAIRRLKARTPRAKCHRIGSAFFDCRVSWKRRGRSHRRLVQVYRENGRTAANIGD